MLIKMSVHLHEPLFLFSINISCHYLSRMEFLVMHFIMQKLGAI